MKTNMKSIIGAILTGALLAGCSAEEYSSVSLTDVPDIANYSARVTVDQEANTATFELIDQNGNLAQGVYPVWNVNAGKAMQSTVNGFKTEKIVVAGDYSYTFTVGNRNGMADGSKEGTFTINTTRYDFSKFANAVGGKPWRVDAAKKAHMGCGPSVEDAAGWWAAGVNEKQDNTIYDDTFTLTFTSVAGGTYSYDPGENGHTFANKDFSAYPGTAAAGGDYDFPSEKTTGTFSLSYHADNDQISIMLPAKMLFPYMAGNSQYNDGVELYVTDWDETHMTVAFAQPGIGWQLIFISGDDDAGEEDFDPDNVKWAAVNAPENLGAGFNTKGVMNFWWANAGWGQIGDPGFSYADGVYTITVTENGGGEWQGQCSITETPLKIEEGAYYDISCKLTASEAIDRITIKVNKDPDAENDPNTLFYKGDIKLKKGDNLIRFAKRMATDAKNGNAPTSFDQAKFIIDLGGAPVGAQVSLSDIIIQKHNPK